jgi:hypothetical protein
VGKLLALVAKPTRTETAGLRETETEKPASGEVPVEVSPVVEESTLSLPETKAVAEKESERKKELKRAPIETRKQGNLF